MDQNLLEEFQIVIIILAVLQIVIWLLLANSVRKTILLIAEENRCILPNQAWFLALPLFNIYWNFEVSRRLSDSLNNEFFDRKIAVEDNPTRRDGFFYAITNLLRNIPIVAFLTIFFFVLSLVNLGIYWYKIEHYRNLIVQHNNWKKTLPDNEN